MITTCQICGRAIAAKTGRIAHHGYRRPGHGWQTQSCFGARYRPYEVACDAIAPAIESLERHRKRALDTLRGMQAEPPASIGYRRSVDSPVKMLARPEGFDPLSDVRANWPGTYEGTFRRRVAMLTAEADACRVDLDVLRRRLADWRAVA